MIASIGLPVISISIRRHWQKASTPHFEIMYGAINPGEGPGTPPPWYFNELERRSENYLFRNKWSDRDDHFQKNPSSQSTYRLASSWSISNIRYTLRKRRRTWTRGRKICVVITWPMTFTSRVVLNLSRGRNSAGPEDKLERDREEEKRPIIATAAQFTTAIKPRG